MSFHERLTNEIMMERLDNINSDRLDDDDKNRLNEQKNVDSQLNDHPRMSPSKRSNHPPESSPQYDRKPVKRKRVSSPSVSTTSLVMIVIMSLIGTVLGANSKIRKSPIFMTVDIFAHRTALLAQFVNGIYLSENASSVTPIQLAEELFSIGPVNLSSLDSSEMTKLETTLGSILKTIDGCGGNGCGVSSDVLNSVKTIVSYKDFSENFNNGLNAGENIDFEVLETLQTSATDAINSARQDIDFMNLNETIYKVQFDIASIKPFMKEADNAVAALEAVKTKITEAESTLQNVRSSFEKIEKVANHAKELNKGSSLKESIRNAGSYSKRFTNIENWFQKIESSLDILSKVNPSFKGSKVLTAGFSNGFDDLKNVHALANDSWLKEFLNSGKEFQLLPFMNLNTLSDTLTPMAVSFKSVRNNINFQASAIKGILTQGIKDGNVSSSFLTSFSNCIKGAQFDNKFDTTNMDKVKQWLDSNPLTTLTTTLDGYITELKKAFEPIKTIIDASSTASVDQDWINKAASGLNTFFGSRKLNPSIKKLSLLDRNLMRPMIVLAKSLGDLATGYSKLNALEETTTAAPQPSKREARFQLKNSGDLNQKFGDISSIVQKLRLLYIMEFEVEEMIDKKKIIDKAIEEIEDVFMKIRLKETFTSKNLEALSKNIKISNDLRNLLRKTKIREMSDFLAPFQLAAKALPTTIDMRLLAEVLKDKIPNKSLAKSIRRLKPLNLQFSNYSNPETIEKTLRDLQIHFDRVFNTGRGKKKEEKCYDCWDKPEEEYDGFFSFLLIPWVRGLLWLVFAFGIWILVIRYQFKEKKKQIKLKKEEEKMEKLNRRQSIQLLEDLKLLLDEEEE
uniref:WSN domain-containing protein n=2 Tax=Caenorhabditis tropicalis TaxID=1561998 RepID=A0A1I7THC2_9PELO